VQIWESSETRSGLSAPNATTNTEATNTEATNTEATNTTRAHPTHTCTRGSKRVSYDFCKRL
jgi:hypothetical protein